MKKELKDFTDEQLKDELRRRERESVMEDVPPIKADINWLDIGLMVAREMSILKNTGAHSKDFEHWLYEKVLKTMYGSDIFDWVNKVSE